VSFGVREKLLTYLESLTPPGPPPLLTVLGRWLSRAATLVTIPVDFAQVTSIDEEIDAERHP
jgi:hypothetical protein